MKHISIDIHFVRDLARHRKLKIQHVSPMDQLTECLTKPLKSSRSPFAKQDGVSGDTPIL